MRFTGGVRRHHPHAQASARYQAGLARIVEVADTQSLLAQAEYQDAVARIDVWRALLADAVAHGDLTPFVTLVSAPRGAVRTGEVRGGSGSDNGRTVTHPCQCRLSSLGGRPVSDRHGGLRVRRAGAAHVAHPEWRDGDTGIRWVGAPRHPHVGGRHVHARVRRDDGPSGEPDSRSGT